MAEEFIKRTKRKANLTIINNEIFQSERMSIEAIGLLCYILSLPDDWIIHKTQLMQKFKIGRDKMNKLFNEIKQDGYLCCVDLIKEKGKFKGTSYVFYDESQKETVYVFPVTGEPFTEKQPLLSTNTILSNNNTKENTDKFDKSLKVEPLIKEDNPEAHALLKYINKNYPTVAKLKPMTNDQCEFIKTTYNYNLIIEKLDAMENKKTLLKDYSQCFLTLKNWCKIAMDSGWVPKSSQSIGGFKMENRITNK